jgi:hypothetical protein
LVPHKPVRSPANVDALGSLLGDVGRDLAPHLRFVFIAPAVFWTGRILGQLLTFAGLVHIPSRTRYIAIRSHRLAFRRAPTCANSVAWGCVPQVALATDGPIRTALDDFANSRIFAHSNVRRDPSAGSSPAIGPIGLCTAGEPRRARGVKGQHRRVTTGRNRDDGRGYFSGFLPRHQRIGTRRSLTCSRRCTPHPPPLISFLCRSVALQSRQCLFRSVY